MPTVLFGYYQVWLKMPSKSLITSWTTSFVPSGTRFSHSRRKAYPGNSSVSSPRRRVLKRLHGLWKGMECSVSNLRKRDFDDCGTGGTSSSRKCQLASDDLTLRRVSSTITIPGVPGATLASRPSPTPSSLVFSPPSPITPTPLPSGVATDSKLSDVEPRDILSDSFNDLSPTLPFSGAAPEPQVALEISSHCRQQPLSLPYHSPLPPRRASTPTPTSTSFGSASGYTLDAATRIQDFHALIDELRATLLHHDSREEFDTGDRCDDDGDERERLLRLLEDVMGKVQQLAENDAPHFSGLGPSVTMTVAAS